MRNLILGVVGIGLALAQTDPVFEVASIKPNNSGSGSSSSDSTNGQIRIVNQSLKRLIERAYDVRDYAFSGPAWLDSLHFDIVAKKPEAVPPDQTLLMLRALLVDQFKLQVHREKKTASGFVLTVAKKGSKLEPDNDTSRSSVHSGHGHMEAQGVSMAKLADFIARQLDQPVEDQTALAGSYNFKLDWSPDGAENSGDKPSLVTALQEQLGLKIQPQKIAIDILVVDHAEKAPVEN